MILETDQLTFVAVTFVLVPVIRTLQDRSSAGARQK
jgi:hypothetical protein